MWVSYASCGFRIRIVVNWPHVDVDDCDDDAQGPTGSSLLESDCNATSHTRAARRERAEGRRATLRATLHAGREGSHLRFHDRTSRGPAVPRDRDLPSRVEHLHEPLRPIAPAPRAHVRGFRQLCGRLGGVLRPARHDRRVRVARHGLPPRARRGAGTAAERPHARTQHPARRPHAAVAAPRCRGLLPLGVDLQRQLRRRQPCALGLRPARGEHARHPTGAMAAVVIAKTWHSFPWIMVVALAVLQTLPSEQIEAATIDGATRSQRFRHISLPHIAGPVTLSRCWSSSTTSATSTPSSS